MSADLAPIQTETGEATYEGSERGEGLERLLTAHVLEADGELTCNEL